MAYPMREASVRRLHILVVSIEVMLGKVVCTSRRQYVLIYKRLIADTAVRMILLNHHPEEVL
jgi:hypothetical protein